uniref:Uncharacterized protein n=1 Tax=Capra hircus TaxID=9925 RepID=A0A8C2NBZ0_CAPHI
VHVFSSSPRVYSPLLLFLPFIVFRERTQSPMYSTPWASSTASCKEESHGEVSPSPTPPSEWEETPLIFTVGQNVNMGARGTPKRTWGSLFLEQSMTKTCVQAHLVNPMHLEAIGTHIQGATLALPCLPGLILRPYIAIGLFRRSQTPFASPRVYWSSSELELVEKTAAPVGAPTRAPGNPVRIGTVAMAPKMLPKHPHSPEENGPGADASLHSSLAGAPLPGFASTPTRLLPKRLIKVCSSPHSRPPPRFHTVCSQAPPRPGVNAHLH